MRHKGHAICKINFSIAALFVVAALCWPFVQRAVNWSYGREAYAFFKKIENSEISYKLVHNRYLPFGLGDNDKELKKLEVDLTHAKYFHFAVLEKDVRTFFIIAQLKPRILKKWYLNGTNTKVRYIYEKKEGETGRLVDSLMAD